MVVRVVIAEDSVLNTCNFSLTTCGSEHWKMLRLLFLCLIVTLRGAAASSEESEGSADVGDGDDEDLTTPSSVSPSLRQNLMFFEPGTDDTVDTNKATGEKVAEDGFTTIVIIVAVSVVALSIAVIVAIVLVRRRMHNRPQGVYSVPAEQGMKGTV